MKKSKPKKRLVDTAQLEQDLQKLIAKHFPKRSGWEIGEQAEETMLFIMEGMGV